MPFKVYQEQKRGGKGVIGAELATDDFVKTQFDANFIGFIIESVYFEFRTNFKTKKLCC